MTVSPNRKMDSALEAARRGLPIYQRIPNSDEPTESQGDCFATTDVNEIRQRWQKNPDQDIGVSAEDLLILHFRSVAGGDAFKEVLKKYDSVTPKTLRLAIAGSDNAALENYYLF